MFLKSRSSWLQHNKELSPVGRAGRKRFVAHKNRQTTNMDTDSLRYVRSPKKYVNQMAASPRLDLSAEVSGKRLPNSGKLDPIDSVYYKKKLVEKESEIFLLQSLYKDTKQQLLQYQKQNPFFAKPIEKPKLFNSPRKDLTPEPRMFTNIDSFNQRMFMQPKFTKSNPKIVLSNPITGIPTNLI